MSEKFSNEATPKYLGYVYQVLIAIECSFNSPNNETIWIECFGDVYDGKTSTEVKHHINKTNLTSNSKDFWKTLKNLISEDTSSFSSFVIHTTSDISKNSFFDNWNNLPKTKKYKLLKEHKPTSSIIPFYDAVIKKNKKADLLPILERLTIKSSQMSVQEKWEELVQDRTFTLIPEEFKEDAFNWVYGYVHKQVIKDRLNWHIKINDFRSACQSSLALYTQEKLPFPSISKTEIDTANKEFLFVKEMKKINCKNNPIERAVSDYLRSKKSEIKFLSYKPGTMPEILEEYDESVLEDIELIKMKYVDAVEECGIETPGASKVSRDLYNEGMNSPLVEIKGVSDTQKYYRNGRIHHNVEERKFWWRYCKEDLI